MLRTAGTTLAGALVGVAVATRYRAVTIRQVVNAEDAVSAMVWASRADSLLDELRERRSKAAGLEEAATWLDRRAPWDARGSRDFGRGYKQAVAVLRTKAEAVRAIEEAERAEASGD